MIILNPNTTNVVVLSLRELTSINNPYYLFRFVSKQSEKEYTCICMAGDLYSFDRYSYNVVCTSGTPNPLNGELNLVYGDEYNYFIYAQASSTNVDYTMSDERVQQGIMKYNKTITERVSYDRGTTTREVYTR